MPLHLGKVVAHGFTIGLSRNDEPNEEGTGVPAVEPPEFHWMLGEDARRFARALLAAADTIDTSREELRRSVGASVSAVMTHKAMTVETLAGLIGMTEGNLWRRLAGSAEFTATDVVRLARALDVEPGVLMPS